MKKACISLSIICVLFMSVMIPAYAANKYNYDAKAGVPVIDGKEDEAWSSVEWEEMKTNSDATIVPFSTKFKVMYSKDTLYVLATVMDETLDVSAADPWNQDSVEFYVDETNSKQAIYDAYDRHININCEGVVTDYINYTPEKLVRESAVQKIDGGYMVEAAIAMEKAELADGTVIGFEMSVNNAKDGVMLNYLRWNAEVAEPAYKDASVFGTVTCLAAETKSDDAAAIEPAEAAPDSTAASNPKTGDAGVIPYVGALLVSGISGFGFIHKRKNQKT